MSGEPLTLKAAWMALVKTFKAADLDSPVADARLLVQHALSLSHEDLLIQSERILTDEEDLRLKALADRRLAHEPVSRIIGRRAFWKGDFIVTPATLDPRADSETLIEAALSYVQPGKGQDPLRVLDIGTGTGCLLISLLQEWPHASGVGIDLSAEAAQVAARNAQAMDVETRAEIVTQGWNDYRADELFDVVISNPPYIGVSEKEDLAAEVLNYDPHLALFADEDGLAAYRAIAARLHLWLKPGGWLLLEIGHTQADAVQLIVAEAGLDILEVRPDLGGRPRVVVAKKPYLTLVH